MVWVVRCDAESLVCIHCTSLVKIWGVSTFRPLFLALSQSVFHFSPRLALFIFYSFAFTTKSTYFAFSYSPYSIVNTSWLFFLLFCTWIFSSTIFVLPNFSSQQFPFLSDMFSDSPISTGLYLSFLYSPNFFLISMLFDLSQFPPFCQPLHLLIISCGSLTMPFIPLCSLTPSRHLLPVPSPWVSPCRCN